jgi:hypothetical protein
MSIIRRLLFPIRLAAARSIRNSPRRALPVPVTSRRAPVQRAFLSEKSPRFVENTTLFCGAVHMVAWIFSDTLKVEGSPQRDAFGR